jgi:hypothetical protein
MRLAVENIPAKDGGVVGNALRAAANYFTVHFASVRKFGGRQEAVASSCLLPYRLLLWRARGRACRRAPAWPVPRHVWLRRGGRPHL